MAKNNGQRITSCTISWENSEDILRVVTRVLQTEIQVRFYSGCDLIFGKIWALSEPKKEELCGVLYKCLDDWYRDDYSADMPAGQRWQFKICTKGRCLRTVVGAEEPPPHGRGIRDIISEIIGKKTCISLSAKARFSVKNNRITIG